MPRKLQSCFKPSPSSMFWFVALCTDLHVQLHKPFVPYLPTAQYEIYWPIAASTGHTLETWCEKKTPRERPRHFVSAVNVTQLREFVESKGKARFSQRFLLHYLLQFQAAMMTNVRVCYLTGLCWFIVWIVQQSTCSQLGPLLA